EECQDQINKYPNSRYKKFSTLKEAQDFVSGVDNKEKKQELSSVYNNEKEQRLPIELVSSQASQDLNTVSRLVAWTDGCSLSNGRDGARAGVGVFWGDNHPSKYMDMDVCSISVKSEIENKFEDNTTWNLSERLPGDKQTNNRAEITAVIRALETCPDRELPLEIKTDSKYTINAYESWMPNWIKNNWMTKGNKPVENKDLFVRLSELIKARPGKVSFTYVPGHVGIPGNEAADRLANLGALKEYVEAVEITKQTVKNSLMNFTEDDLFSSEELAAIAAEIHSSR
ncbi:36557_t:CDS:2, partial [Gigaspora margarita]